MSSDAEDRAEMPEGSSEILDRRSMASSNANVIPLLKPGMTVLDIGCGSGPITRDIAKAVGPTGTVIGLDASPHLIQKANTLAVELPQLSYLCEDLFKYQPEHRFDLITAARVLQWLEEPVEALQKMCELLNPGGQITILDYNHVRILWEPFPPDSAMRFYQAFLDWRSDAGLNNEIADQLVGMFEAVGLREIEVTAQHEPFSRGEPGFEAHVGIWKKVMETRGKQVVEDGFLAEGVRLQAIEDYGKWMEQEAQSMRLYLLGISGKMS